MVAIEPSLFAKSAILKPFSSAGHLHRAGSRHCHVYLIVQKVAHVVQGEKEGIWR